MKIRSVSSALLVSAAVLVAVTAQAQLGKPTAEELQRRGNGPGPVAGAGGNAGTSTAEAPSKDPRDFAGTWRANMGPGGPGGAPGGAPGGGGGPGGPGGGAPGGAPGGAGGPGGPGAGGGAPVAPGGGGGTFGGPGAGGPPPGAPAGLQGKKGSLNQRVVCVPPDGTQVGVDGPLLLVQTPQQITWAAEEMHSIRRIFLTGTFTPNFKPNYLGEAIGHWEGNTLVVETRGLNSLPGGKRIEHWSKSADGSQLVMKVESFDASGKSSGEARTTTLNWAPGQEVLEWMCEDFNDNWLPGGKDYKDQIVK